MSWTARSSSARFTWASTWARFWRGKPCALASQVRQTAGLTCATIMPVDSPPSEAGGTGCSMVRQPTQPGSAWRNLAMADVRQSLRNYWADTSAPDGASGSANCTVPCLDLRAFMAIHPPFSSAGAGRNTPRDQVGVGAGHVRSEEHTSELQSHSFISYAV